MSRRTGFALAVGLQLAILLVMIGMKWSTLTYGTRIMLKTQPVDPWDVFRGDYIILNYEISGLDLNSVKTNSTEFRPNETVYVVLGKQGRHHTAAAVQKNEPQGGTLFIRGNVAYYDEYSKNLRVNYGIDSYYVPQHQGKPIERAMKPLDVEVAVDRRGSPAVVKIFMDGKEVTFE